MSNRRKRPAAKVVPKAGRHAKAQEASKISGGRRPRIEFTPAEPDGKVVILFSRIDLDSRWCLTKISQDDHRALLSRVKSFESMTVQEVFYNGEEPGKDYPLPDLPTKEALDRLRELTYDDRDQISRLRISGTGRLYGFREGARFYALWWDPEHEVWPSKKKNT